ncbi:MAG TPA: pyridoxamine 5'-phosphate oxidase family protein [Dehalococcoidia bacterium]|nr:pyridoxamine 5'-phosphate oxidase family protein [Dehalococcoidia bacterium]
MPRISPKLALTSEELDRLMLESWNMRIATLGPGSRINLTPLWFAWVNGKVYFTCRGQKVVNLRRDSNATVLVDKNERFPELVGAMLQGSARVLETAEEEAADPDLEEARWQMGTKYAGGHGEAAAGRRRNNFTARGETNRWVVFEPHHVITWDNFKLASLRG